MRHSNTSSESHQASGVTQTQQSRSLAQGKPIMPTQSTSLLQSMPSTPATTFTSRYLSTSNIPFTLGSHARTNTSTTDNTNTTTADNVNTNTTDTKRNLPSNSKLARDDRAVKTDNSKKFKASSKHEEMMKPMPMIPSASSASVSMEQKGTGIQFISQSAQLTTESTASSHKTISSPYPSSLVDETSKLEQISKSPRITSPRLSKNKKPEILKSSTTPAKSAEIKEFFSGVLTPVGNKPPPTQSALRESGTSSESALSSSQTAASSPAATSLIPVHSSESRSASDVEADNCVDAAETPKTVDDEAKVDLGCELRFETFIKPENNGRGKSKSKETSFTHSCETTFESEDAQIKHYLEHLLAQGPHLQCPVKNCRMVLFSDKEMAEHSLKFHQKTLPTSPPQPTQKSQQQSKHKRTRLQSKGGKANSSTPVISTIVVATSNPGTKPKSESKLTTTSNRKRKSLKASRSSRSESNSSQKNEDLFYEDAPPIVLGRLFTR
ncbi:hypothetical protein BGX21_007554 [Mortierella sp. AD011]|nr:hypothetical protein BGX20_006837 [Mortierella sp. AD010]KAF9398604.1 hypothetical protein BGX21_007554 [Mortierella sp. AD011]